MECPLALSSLPESYMLTTCPWNESTSLEQPAGQMHSGPPCRGCLYLSVMNMDTMYPPSVTTALATAGVWTEMVGSWRVAVPHLG